MRKTIAAATVATSLAAGGLVGMVVGTPSVASATESAVGAANWVQDALAGLVGAGTIDQGQADAVEAALAEARPRRGPGHHLARHLDLPAVAEVLGMTDAELRSALEGDQTLASIAAERNVEVARVVDALVVTHRERLAAKVTTGELTEKEADERLAGAKERATALVDGGMAVLEGGPGHRPGRGMRHGGPGGAEGEGA